MQIITKRKFEYWPSFDLVYEWEDIFSKELPASLLYEPKILNRILCNRYLNHLPIPNFIQTSKQSFIFEMYPILRYRINNKRNIIPCIIDFFLEQSQLSQFTKAYNKNPIVFISSREVYDFLKENKCPLNFKHLPLSISDKYRITPNTKFQKKYDLVTMGLRSPVLESYIKQYIERHKDFKYVYRIAKDGEFKFMCYTSDGECLGDINTREKYIDLMRKSRCWVYATPGMDGGEKRTKGFNQVTPRFLEIIASGCHVVGRYPQNSDTEFYEVNKFMDSVNSYEAFEKAMDKARNTEVDMQMYSDYLAKHYTSERVKLFKQYMEKL